MFKHILIPTDGSPIAAKAIAAGIALARHSGARVTGYCALNPVPAHLYRDGYARDEKTLAELERRRRSAARRNVAAIARAARKARVPFEPVVQAAGTPYEGIAEAAQKRNCDLILMASHGRRGLARLALGSVADRVMKLSKVPVLVYRQESGPRRGPEPIMASLMRWLACAHLALPRQRAREILEQCYAGGRLTREQFERMKADLSSGD